MADAHWVQATSKTRKKQGESGFEVPTSLPAAAICCYLLLYLPSSTSKFLSVYHSSVVASSCQIELSGSGSNMCHTANGYNLHTKAQYDMGPIGRRYVYILHGLFRPPREILDVGNIWSKLKVLHM